MGLGTRAVATARNFSAGNLRATSAPLDLAIEGDGFFQISLPDGTTGYTRAGTFHLDAQGLMVTSEGYSLDPQITIPSNATSVSISKDGIVSATVAGQTAAQQLGTIEIATFSERRPACGRSAATCSRRRRPRASRRPARRAPTRAARWRRASSRTRTSASSRRWST